ncbi:Ac81-like protein [Macrobrachium rosenbergii nudivirus]|nr:Ac81-like protein [Macrobrachium rosenbergii nudivirus]
MTDIAKEEIKGINIIIYSKTIKNTCGIFTHMYLAIPEMDLEIHPGRFFYGTHHDFGKFKNRSTKVKELQFCDKCLKVLLDESIYLFDVWYYPILNCETLSRALTQHVPISIQTILCTVVFTTFVLAISMNLKILLITLFFLLLLLLYNNLPYKFLNNTCIHIKNTKRM